jgi:hypothetical protein
MVEYLPQNSHAVGKKLWTFFCSCVNETWEAIDVIACAKPP